MSNRIFTTPLACLIGSCYLALSIAAYAAIGARVPISADTATAMAGSAFPLTVTMERGKVFLTEPKVSFTDAQTISLQVRLHVYDHRPAEGVALSEMAHAVVTAQPDYDRGKRQILLKNPQL
ncbi:MAG: hypothetical protein HKN19_02445, partial [Halioglobus sp.]|nr:hypothetical protein [Halioglobus sp.]